MMKRFFVLLCALLVGGCAAPSSSPLSAPSPSPSSPPLSPRSSPSPSPPLSSGPPVPSASMPAAGPQPSRTCLSGQNHFAGDADTAPPVVCVNVGAVVDLNALAVGGYQPGAGHWTAVTSSDTAVLTCTIASGHATCTAVGPGQALATATGAAGAWRAQVFVAKRAP
jgi:hypothetical protein